MVGGEGGCVLLNAFLGVRPLGRYLLGTLAADIFDSDGVMVEQGACLLIFIFGRIGSSFSQVSGVRGWGCWPCGVR